MTIPAHRLSPDEELRLVVRRIVDGYDPDRIILYGSFAYGTPDEGSDFDLLIVKETSAESHERRLAVRESAGEIPSGTPLETIVVTPGELEGRLALGDPFFANILERGRVLYEKDEAHRSSHILRERRPSKRPASEIIEEWYALGARDLGAAQVLMEDRDELLPVAGTLLQQAVEKFLKGHLLSRGWPLHRTHDLKELIASAQEYGDDFTEFSGMCGKLTDFYREGRYSTRSGPAVSRTELEQLFAEAESLIARIRGLTPPPPPAEDSA